MIIREKRLHRILETVVHLSRESLNFQQQGRKIIFFLVKRLCYLYFYIQLLKNILNLLAEAFRLVSMFILNLPQFYYSLIIIIINKCIQLQIDQIDVLQII